MDWPLLTPSQALAAYPAGHPLHELARMLAHLAEHPAVRDAGPRRLTPPKNDDAARISERDPGRAHGGLCAPVEWIRPALAVS